MATKIISDLYLLRCITNLHAGSGDTNYGIVDKTVQRDPIDSMPVIHASSIKGALREAFVYRNGDNTVIDAIFGTDTKTMNDKPEKARAGKFHFYGARLLFMPVRTNQGQYFLSTTPSTIFNFQKIVSEDFGIDLTETEEKLFNNLNSKEEPQKGAPIVFVNDVSNLMVDEFEASDNGGSLDGEFGTIKGSRVAFFHQDDLSELCKNRLPVIARNHLDNGISTNLWYEEVVPREAHFYFFVSRPADNDDFETGLNKMKHRVQIGANASVGYGLCQLTRIKSSSDQ